MTIMNPGDELSIVHEIWLQSRPTMYEIKPGGGFIALELAPVEYRSSPFIELCQEGKDIYHSKIRGMLKQ